MELMVEDGGIGVAKKKSSREGKSAAGAQVHVECSAEWKAWLVAFAASEDKPLSRHVRAALRAWAKERGFKDPPER
jgi:hypothetical protein